MGAIDVTLATSEGTVVPLAGVPSGNVSLLLLDRIRSIQYSSSSVSTTVRSAAVQVVAKLRFLRFPFRRNR